LWRVGRASDQEGLRLMLAYLQISDPALRKQVVRLAEKFAGHPQPMLVSSLTQDNVEAVDIADTGKDDEPQRDPPL
jgi:hypothetical protein